MNQDRSIRAGALLLIALLVLTAGSKSILYDTMDPDCFWHLRIAEQLRHEGIGPIVDRLSFMSMKTAWTPYSWLAELGMKTLWDAGGFQAAIVAQALMIAGMYTLIAMACWRRTESRLGVIVILLGAIFMSLPYLSFRPATAALLMLACAVWVLLKDLDAPSWFVWMLAPWTVLMVNVHLFAVIVPVLVGGVFIGAIIERRSNAYVGRYGILLGLTSLTCLMTPMLGGLVRTMWHFQSDDAMVGGPGIAEMQPFYGGTMGWVGVSIVIGCYILAWRARERMRPFEWLWLFGATALLFRMGRFAPLFVIIAGPVVTRAMPAMRGVVLGKPMVRFALLALIGVGMMRIVAGFPARMSMDAWLNRNGPDTPGYPCAAAAYVEANVPHASGRVLNEFSWGGYLAWRLGPQFQTFMDGRTQLFPNAFWQATSLGSPADLQRFLGPIAADAAIVPKNHGNLRAALIALGWKSVYADDRAEVYVPGMPVAHTD